MTRLATARNAADVSAFRVDGAWPAGSAGHDQDGAAGRGDEGSDVFGVAGDDAVTRFGNCNDRAVNGVTTVCPRQEQTGLLA